MTARRPAASTLDWLPAEAAFLDPLRLDHDRPGDARAVVIPFGLEASVSYGGGTRAGPAAILAASHQLELYDEEFSREVYLDAGIATVCEPKIAKSVPKALDQLAALVETVLAAGKLPFVLGGEHALTAGAIRPLARKYPDLVVLQFDAHADLRDGYLSEHYSHAAAMRRVLDQPGHEHIRMVQVGIRALSKPEADFAAASPHRIAMHLGLDQASWDMEAILAPLRGKPVYVTVDIDALDGSIMPATGTPTPGGMSYLQLLAYLRRAAEIGTVVGMDLVEFAPIKGFHAYDFLAAQLAAKMLAYALAGRGVRS